jgi:muconolactone delta-isomerase
MLYCIRMDVRVPHALASKQLERLKAEEKARASARGAARVPRAVTQPRRREGR